MRGGQRESRREESGVLSSSLRGVVEITRPRMICMALKIGRHRGCYGVYGIDG